MPKKKQTESQDSEQKPKKKNKGGRPTDYNPEIAKRICDLVATTPYGLLRLTQMYDDLPDKATINVWRRKHSEFHAQYAKAKIAQAEILTEECLDISDDGANDYMESLTDGVGAMGYKVLGEAVNRSRLRIDTRKWLASKLLPKMYGDASQLAQVSEENEGLKEELRELRKKLNEQHQKDF